MCIASVCATENVHNDDGYGCCYAADASHRQSRECLAITNEMECETLDAKARCLWVSGESARCSLTEGNQSMCVHHIFGTKHLEMDGVIR